MSKNYATRNTMSSRIALSFILFSLVSCIQENPGIGTSPSEDSPTVVDHPYRECVLAAQAHCRCGDEATQAQITACYVFTRDLCLDYPNLPEWSNACIDALDTVDCPLDGPVPLECAY